MDKRIRWLGLVFIACFLVLFLQLNNWQFRESKALTANPHNVRTRVDPMTLPRGEILTSDGAVLAYSQSTKDVYGQLRVYPYGPLFAGITGYFDVAQGAFPYGIEAQYNSYLTLHETPVKTLGNLLTQQQTTDNVVLTVSKKLQMVAAAALGNRWGSVVAIDPRTGAVLALYSNPSFNPNELSSHNPAAINKYYNSLNPLQFPNFATTALFPPGSTFKTVTTSAIFDRDPKLAQKVWPQASSVPIGDGQFIHNFAGETCGGDLAQVLAISCDTAYSLIGLSLGAQNLYSEATSFGWNKKAPLDLPSSEISAPTFPGPFTLGAGPLVAYSGIGQFDDTASVLQMALVAAGLANNGVIMTPHLLAHVVNDYGQVVYSYPPKPWLTATSSSTANEVRHLMLGVTQPGGTAGGVPWPSGVQIAAKTGTAEFLKNSPCSHAWLLALAPAGAGQTPTVAVAAVVPYIAPSPGQPGNPADGQLCLGVGTSGAGTAGPIVSTVLTAALQLGL